MNIKNERWSSKKFNETRQEVLRQWPTGQGVNLEEAFEYHRNLPKNKVMAHVMKDAKDQGKTLIQPHSL